MGRNSLSPKRLPFSHLASMALLLRMAKAQQIGRKTGRGFFDYA